MCGLRIGKFTTAKGKVLICCVKTQINMGLYQKKMRYSIRVFISGIDNGGVLKNILELLRPLLLQVKKLVAGQVI